MNNLYNEKIESLISAALADGELTEKEKQILFKKAQAEGIDLDEFEMVLDARLVEIENAQKANKAQKADKAQSTTSAPKSNKYGDVRKCPVCGAMVPALAGVCPECGFEFSGIEANLSSQKLADLILEAHSDEKRKVIIETFPIPNTKADLFEFLTSIQPRMRDVKNPLSGSYFKKYEECINKAKISFANDPNLRSFIESFENEKSSLKKKNAMLSTKKGLGSFFSWCGKHKVISGITFFTLFSIILSLFATMCQSHQESGINDAKETIEEAITTGNKESIMDAIKDSPKMNDVESLVKKLIDAGNLEAAMYLIDNRSYTGISNELCNALIEAERMDDAWKYHTKGDYSSDKPRERMAYMSDVVRYYCKQGNKDKARQFVNSHLDWFISNVDSRGDFYSKELKSENVKKSLMELIKNY